MTAFVTILQYTAAAAFLLLGLSTAVEALQQRERARIVLALGLVLFSLVPVIARVQAALGTTRSVALEYVAVLALLGSGYCILRFRACFVPLGRPGHLAAAGAVAATALLVLAAGLPPDSRLPAPYQGLVADALILAWVGLVGEPVVRFWLASRGQPPVQRARLRGLSVGFAVLIAILLVGTVAGSRLQSPLALVVTQLAALAMVPVLYGSLSRPGQLRRLWRTSEQDEMQQAMGDLLVFSSDRPAAAARAVRWTARLVGGDAALVLDRDGLPLAAVGMSPELVSAASDAWREEPEVEAFARRRVLPESAIALGLPMEGGLGLLAALPGPFTLVFGVHEVGQLRAYASSVAASLERVRVTERLSALERAKGQFLNLASHELRGPVAIIRGYLSMLERGRLGTLSQPGLQAVRIMSTKVVEMSGLIEQMLDAARLEEGRLQLRLRPVDVRTVVEQAVETVRPLADESHPLLLSLDRQPLVVPVDAERVQTILTNLVDNAIKYSPAGGPVECRVTGTDDSVLVAVHDHGVGIAADDLPRLFSRFSRVSSEATRHIPGIGLGLYLARELARLHGGDIDVESKPGAGSTFVLSLPRGRPGGRPGAPELAAEGGQR